MATVREAIDGRLREVIERQPVFFVGTAPSGADGHVNVSPKGLAGTFVVLGGHRVAYLDYTGSGAEGIAHIRENGRIVVMFCAFEGPPTVVRLHGTARVVLPGDADYADLRASFGAEREVGVRAVVDVAVTRISDSCGYAVPLMRYEGQRDLLDRWSDRKTPEELSAYRARKNATSIDGLPALDVTGDAPASAGRARSAG